MRICYLSNSSMPSSVASSIQTIKMCEAFSTLNNKVFLITTNTSKATENIFKYYDVKSKFLFKKLVFFKKFPLGINYYLFSIFSIIESFKYKPQLYITRNFFTCFLLVLLRKKIVLELHHDLNTESRIVRLLVNNFRFLNSKFVKKIIAITKGVKNEYVKKYLVDPTKIKVLPSGSSIKNNFNFHINKKFLKIGYFGSLYKSRGFDLICNLAKIDKKNKYYLYGDTRKLSLCRMKGLFKNLYLHSHVPYREIPKNLAKMDILILPYVSDITVAGDVGDITKFTSPLKLFDYLSAGKIIICSDYKVLKEVIDRKNAIFIKNYKKIYSWKNEIDKLSNLPQKQLIMSKNNHNLSKNYTLKSRAKKILKEIY